MPDEPAPPLPTGWRVEPIDLARDLDEVMTVDAASFPNPWTRAMFLHEAEGTDVGALLVLRSAEGQVAGYCACWVVAGELHVNNIAVAPAWRGRRLGSALLGAVLDRARRLGATRATLEVRSSNTAALALYARFGFEVVSVRRGYYHNPADDGLILWKCELGPP